MNTRTSLLLVSTLGFGSALVATGCGSAAPAEPPATAIQARAAHATPSRSMRPESASSTQDTCVPNASVHFALDSSDLDNASRDQLAKVAACLQNADKRAQVVGMTDPRGTEEYNLALGERRAQASARYMTSMGADSSRVQTRSVGEEYAHGDDETEWASDRRSDVSVQ